MSHLKYTTQLSWISRPNSSLQNRLVRWGVPPLYKLFSRILSIRCGTKSHPRELAANTPPHASARSQRAWSVDDASPTMDPIGSDTMSWISRPNSSLQNRLVRWGVSPLYKLFSRILSIRCGTKSHPRVGR